MTSSLTGGGPVFARGMKKTASICNAMKCAACRARPRILFYPTIIPSVFSAIAEIETSL